MWVDPRCGAACQKEHWNSGHKQVCGLASAAIGKGLAKHYSGAGKEENGGGGGGGGGDAVPDLEEEC